jgi:hypothetical protein
MTGDDQPDGLQCSDSSQIGGSSQIPQTITETIFRLKDRVLRQLSDTVSRQQLFYHNEDHIRAVQRRSHQIFAVVSPALPPSIDRARAQLLLDLCAVAHDLVQQFVSGSEVHATRQRRSGVSEIATIDQLIDWINLLNQQLEQQIPNHSAKLTDADIAVIRQAIQATICVYDPQDGAIYQPLLYGNEPLSVVSRILALADLGTLGIDGIEAYNREGSLLFLEENPDVVSLLHQGSITSLADADPSLAENVRQRLLKRCRFQVNFAKSRLNRLKPELQGLPERTISILTTEVFKHLSPTTVQTVEATTPTDSATTIDVLLQFFQLEQYSFTHIH